MTGLCFSDSNFPVLTLGLTAPHIRGHLLPDLAVVIKTRGPGLQKKKKEKKKPSREKKGHCLGVYLYS